MPYVTILIWLAALHLASAADRKAPILEEVASFPKQQVTGVTVSKAGRIFVNFPFWSDDHTTSVAEVMPDGSAKPFPDDNWNRKQGAPADRWVCVQSVVVDDQDALWVLDPASPKTEAVVKGGPKLVKIDLTSNKVVQTIPFDEQIAPERSYLNDVRVDTANHHAYITESGTGALVIVDLATSKARRVLSGHPSTQVEAGTTLVVDGFKLVDPKTRKAPEFHADGIALDPQGGWLYYHPLTGHTMYRVKTSDLRDASLSDDQLGKKVENVGTTPAPDGMLEGSDGTVYLAAFEKDAIARYDSKTRKTEIVVQDARLQWPDTLAWGPDGKLYVTTSQIHRMPKYHGGESKQQEPYRVYRVTLSE